MMSRNNAMLTRNEFLMFRAICMNFGQLCELDLSGMPVMTHGSPGEPLSLTYLIEVRNNDLEIILL